MAQLVLKKLKGSTLVEVMVAAVIIVVIFLLASTLIAKLWQSGPSFRKLEGHGALIKVMKQYQNNAPLDTLGILPEGLEISEEKEMYNGNKDVQQVHLFLKEKDSGSTIDGVIFLVKDEEKTSN